MVDWSRVEFFWGDERAVPTTDPDSNFSLARALWLDKVPVVGGQAKRYWSEFADDAAKLLQQVDRAAEEELPHDKVQTSEVASPGTTAAAPVASPPNGVESRLVNALKQIINWARLWLPRVGLAIGRGVLEVALSVFLTFFILRDGAAAANRLTIVAAGVTLFEALKALTTGTSLEVCNCSSARAACGHRSPSARWCVKPSSPRPISSFPCSSFPEKT